MSGLKKIVVVGSGGREHALAWRLARGAAGVSDRGDVPHARRDVVVVPGNDGIARSFLCAPEATSTLAIADACAGADLVVVGPEKYLDDGLVDVLAARGVPCFGPSKAAARLESDKAFMKDIARAAGVQTADFVTVTADSRAAGHAFIDERAARGQGVVVKASGLCAGKGVVVVSANDVASAHGELDAMLGGVLKGKDAAPRFGDASRTVVLEDLLPGQELSVFALCNGDDCVILGAARDHKRIFDGDQGPNTGGMGAVGPLGADDGVSDALLSRLKKTVFVPTLRELARRGTPFRGVLFAGLMIDSRGASGGDDVVMLLEFNVRFGDPETEALLFAIDVDIAPLLLACATGAPLPQASSLVPAGSDKGAVVVVAAEGYPEDPVAGGPILGVFDAAAVPLADVFFAGVKNGPFGLIANGGRVLAVCGRGATFDHALDAAYAAVGHVRLEGGQHRTDIGASVRRRRAM